MVVFTPAWFLVGSVLLIVLVFCVVFFALFVFVLCLVYPMLHVSLDCPFLIAPSVFSTVYWLPVSLDCPILIAPSVLAAVYWLPVSLHCPFLIDTSGFSNVIFCHTYVVYVLSPRYKVHFTRKSYDCNLPVHIIIMSSGPAQWPNRESREK